MTEMRPALRHGRPLLFTLLLGSCAISVGLMLSVVFGGAFWAVFALGAALMAAAGGRALLAPMPSRRWGGSAVLTPLGAEGTARNQGPRGLA